MEPKSDERSTIMISGEEYRTVRDVCWDAPKRAAEFTSQGTDKQVLSPLPELLMYHLDPKDGADLARHLNETIAGMVAAEPGAPLRTRLPFRCRTSNWQWRS